MDSFSLTCFHQARHQANCMSSSSYSYRLHSFMPDFLLTFCYNAVFKQNSMQHKHILNIIDCLGLAAIADLTSEDIECPNLKDCLGYGNNIILVSGKLSISRL